MLLVPTGLLLAALMTALPAASWDGCNAMLYLDWIGFWDKQLRVVEIIIGATLVSQSMVYVATSIRGILYTWIEIGFWTWNKKPGLDPTLSADCDKWLHDGETGWTEYALLRHHEPNDRAYIERRLGRFLRWAAHLKVVHHDMPPEWREVVRRRTEQWRIDENCAIVVVLILVGVRVVAGSHEKLSLAGWWYWL